MYSWSPYYPAVPYWTVVTRLALIDGGFHASGRDRRDADAILMELLDGLTEIETGIRNNRLAYGIRWYHPDWVAQT